MPADKIQKTAAFFGVSVGYLFGEYSEASNEFNSLQELILKQQNQLKEIEKHIQEQSKTIENIAKSMQIKNE